MRTPNQYFADRFPWLTRARAVAGSFGIALLVVFIWPHARLVIDLVIVTAIPGTIGAIVFGLTFWSKARVQIGRRQLRYKAVRRVAGIVALACLPFILTQRASIYLRSPSEVVSEASQAYPDMKHWRIQVVVAIAHLEGDDGNRLEGRLRDALAGLDPRWHITPVILNRTIAVSGRPQGIAHLDALGAVTDLRVDALIWGGAKGVAHPAVGPLYETMFGSDPQFGGTYLPSDFKLPELQVDDLCTVLRLIAATQSAHFMQQLDFKSYFKFGDALEPLIKQVRSIADDPRKTSDWSADTRARLNLALGIANRISGLELNSGDSLHAAVAYLKRTQADWTRDRDPLEWAMVQQNIGFAMSYLAEHDLQVAPLRAAVASYKDALAVYQARSDRLDMARVQLELGVAFEKIGQPEAGVESLRQAADYYRAALMGFDVRYYWSDWAESQRNLGGTLQMLADRDGSVKEYEDAIAADREALKVYHKQSEPIMWAATQSQIAKSLDKLGWATSNRDDFKQSIAMSRQLLEGYPREINPLVWAGIQTNLGEALIGLSGLNPDSETQYPQQAAVAFRAALEELSIEHQPSDWAIAKTGLGNALLELGENGSDTYYAEQAIDAFNDALKVITPDRGLIAWAWTKYDLGDALVELGERGAGVRRLKEAVDTYREALTMLSKDKSPQLWGKIQDHLNIALDDLHRRGWNGS